MAPGWVAWPCELFGRVSGAPGDDEQDEAEARHVYGVCHDDMPSYLAGVAQESMS